jgi:hypothetical protein
MTIILEQSTLPERGVVEIHFNQTFEIKVTAEEARRQVNRWLLMEVSCMMGAEPPSLVVGQRVVWRVPAHFSAPQVGRVGVVGMVDVDVSSGKLYNTAECKRAIEQCAAELASRLPSYQPLLAIPAISISQHLSPAPILVLPDEEPIHVIAGG